MSIGIIGLDFATTHYKVELDTLAAGLGVDPNKFRYGLRQEQFSMPAIDEDPVTLAATATSRLLARTGTDGIRTLVFATESGVDQSKSAGLFLRSLLDLPAGIRMFEMKQACYAGTAALQAALGIVARNPQERVLVVMSDVARYAVDTPGEPTQGAGAVAMLVGADPQLLEIEPHTGVWSSDTDDFWRPNDLSTPLVDGALSLEAYLDALTGSWDDFTARSGLGAADIDHFVHHQPFTKMAVKAFAHFVDYTGVALDAETQLEPGLAYTPRIGNSYAASLFIGLTALLHGDKDLTGDRVALYSYGSGAVGEFFTGKVVAGYRDALDRERFVAELDAREDLSFVEYRTLHAAQERGSKTDFENPRVTDAPFRFAGVKNGARYYEKNTAD